MELPEWPTSEYPSLTDCESGNLSQEWIDYFNILWRSFGGDQRSILTTWSQNKAEAKALFEMMHSGLSLSEIEKYLKDNPPSAKLIIHLLIVTENQFKSENARNSVQKKLANDPRQLDKLFVQQCWEDWQKEPHRYKSKAAFAKDMLEKCEHLNSQKKIEDWCREWTKK